MSVDPNIYALNMELSLSTVSAYNELDKFEKSVVDLEESVSSAAQNAINEISRTIDNAAKGLDSIADSIKGINSESDILSSTMSGIGINTSDFGDNVSDQMDDIKKSIDYWQQIHDLNEEIVDFGEQELDRVNSYIKVIQQITKAVDTKNKSHEEELGLVESEFPALQDIYDSYLNIGSAVDDSAKKNRNLFNIIKQVVDVFARADKATDNFTQANYRLYGSQQEIIQNVRILSGELGVTESTTIAAYKALADIKYPREEIGKLAGEIGRLNLITGSSVDTMVLFTHEMRQSGFDAAETSRQLNIMAAAQRSLGLSTFDLNKVMQGSALTISQQLSMFGKDAPAAFQMMDMGLRAISKQVGMSEADIVSWNKSLQATGVESVMIWQRLAGLTAAEASKIENRYGAMGTAAQNFARQAGMSLESLADPSGISQSQQIKLQALADAYEVTVEQMSSMARASLNLTDAQKEQLMTTDGLNKVFEETLKRQKMWSETQATLTRQLQKLKNSLSVVLNVILQLGADALIPLLKVLNVVLSSVAGFINLIRSAIGWLEEWIPGFGYVVSAAKFMIGWVLIAGAAFTVFYKVGAILGGFFNFVTTGMNGIAGVFTSGFNIIKSITSGIMQVLNTIVKGLATSIRIIGKAASTVMLPLLALGAAMLMTGTAAYMLAQSVKIIAEVGWDAVPAIIGLIAAVSILGGVLIFLGSLAQGPVALGMLAVGATLMMVGAAAWLVGAGVDMMANAFLKLAQAVGMLSTDVLPNFASSLLRASYDMFEASVLLLPAVLALLPGAIMLGIVGGILGLSLSIFSYAIGALGDAGVRFEEGIKGILNGSDLINSINWGKFLSSAIALAKIGAALLAASVLFTPAAYIIGSAGLILGSGLKSMAKGAELASSIDFVELANNLMAGGLVLLSAAPIIAYASAAIMPGGLLLLAAGASLLVGASALYAASYLINSSAEYLEPAAAKIKAAVDMLKSSSDDMRASVDDLIVFGSRMAAVGVSLLIGSMSLGVASVALYGASSAIYLANAVFTPAAAALYLSGSVLYGASELILIASYNLLFSFKRLSYASDTSLEVGYKLALAGTMVMSGAAMLASGAFILGLASSLMVLAGSMLLPASISMFFGMLWLSMALSKFWSIAPKIDTIGKGMLSLATGFMILTGLNFGGLTNAAEAGLSSIPKLNQFATELDRVSVRFDDSIDRFSKLDANIDGFAARLNISANTLENSVDKFASPVRKLIDGLNISANSLDAAVNKFSTPADRLVETLLRIQNVVNNIDFQGLNLESDIGRMGINLEEYATMLERASERMEVAINSKAIPTIENAENAGITGISRPDSIMTVKILDQREGGEVNKSEELLTTSNMLLIQLLEALKLIDNQSGKSIYDLLESHLPQLKNDENGLISNELNEWNN